MILPRIKNVPAALHLAEGQRTAKQQYSHGSHFRGLLAQWHVRFRLGGFASPFYHSFKVMVVIGVVRPHHPIPEIKVKSVIIAGMLVVHIVVSRRVDPFKKTVASEAFRCNFVACVAQYIDQNTPQYEEKKYRCVDRKYQRHHWNDCEFQHGFQWMER